MWYKTKLTVSQNDFFYTQKGVTTHAKNKIDSTVYEFQGQLGSWFQSIERKEPKIGENRWICETEFRAWKVYPKKRYGIFTVYQIWWVPVQGTNTVEEIREFYVDKLLKMSLPQRIKDEEIN